MSNVRFNWADASNDSFALELKRRAEANPGCRRKLYKDSDLTCRICNKRPKDGHEVYYPSIGFGEGNKIIGHVKCVDAQVENMDSRIAQELAAGAPLLSKTSVPTVKPPLKSAVPNFSSDMVAELQRLRGYRAGVRFASGQKEPPDTTAGIEWLEGWQEGVAFVMELQRGA